MIFEEKIEWRRHRKTFEMGRCMRLKEVETRRRGDWEPMQIEIHFPQFTMGRRLFFFITDLHLFNPQIYADIFLRISARTIFFSLIHADLKTLISADFLRLSASFILR